MVKKHLMLLLLVAGLSTQFTYANRTVRTLRLAQAAARSRKSNLPVIGAEKAKQASTPLAQVTPKQQEVVHHVHQVQPQSLGQTFKEGLVWSAAWHTTGAIIRGIFEMFKGE